MLYLNITAQAQDNTAKKSESSNNFYKTAIGVRLGNENGLNIKHFISANTAIEGILSRDYFYYANRITALYEIQNKISGFNHLSWYFGFGAHVSLYRPNYGNVYNRNGYYDYRGKWHKVDYTNNYTSLGFDGIIGLDYKFSGFPIVMSADIKPSIDFMSGPRSLFSGAFSLRYIVQ
jgi:hypothetical protein